MSMATTLAKQGSARKAREARLQCELARGVTRAVRLGFAARAFVNVTGQLNFNVDHRYQLSVPVQQMVLRQKANKAASGAHMSWEVNNQDPGGGHSRSSRQVQEEEEAGVGHHYHLSQVCEGVCAQVLDALDFVHVTGTLRFNVDNRRLVRMNVSHMVLTNPDSPVSPLMVDADRLSPPPRSPKREHRDDHDQGLAPVVPQHPVSLLNSTKMHMFSPSRAEVNMIYNDKHLRMLTFGRTTQVQQHTQSQSSLILQLNTPPPNTTQPPPPPPADHRMDWEADTSYDSGIEPSPSGPSFFSPRRCPSAPSQPLPIPPLGGHEEMLSQQESLQIDHGLFSTPEELNAAGPPLLDQQGGSGVGHPEVVYSLQLHPVWEPKTSPQESLWSKEVHGPSNTQLIDVCDSDTQPTHVTSQEDMLDEQMKESMKVQFLAGSPCSDDDSQPEMDTTDNITDFQIAQSYIGRPVTRQYMQTLKAITTQPLERRDKSETVVDAGNDTTSYHYKSDSDHLPEAAANSDKNHNGGKEVDKVSADTTTSQYQHQQGNGDEDCDGDCEMTEDDDCHSNKDSNAAKDNDCHSDKDGNVTEDDDCHSNKDRNVTEDDDCHSNKGGNITEDGDCHVDMNGSVTEDGDCHSNKAGNVTEDGDHHSNKAGNVTEYGDCHSNKGGNLTEDGDCHGDKGDHVTGGGDCHDDRGDHVTKSGDCHGDGDDNMTADGDCHGELGGNVTDVGDGGGNVTEDGDCHGNRDDNGHRRDSNRAAEVKEYNKRRTEDGNSTSDQDDEMATDVGNNKRSIPTKSAILRKKVNDLHTATKRNRKCSSINKREKLKNAKKRNDRKHGRDRKSKGINSLQNSCERECLNESGDDTEKEDKPERSPKDKQCRTVRECPKELPVDISTKDKTKNIDQTDDYSSGDDDIEFPKIYDPNEMTMPYSSLKPIQCPDCSFSTTLQGLFRYHKLKEHSAWKDQFQKPPITTEGTNDTQSPDDELSKPESKKEKTEDPADRRFSILVPAAYQGSTYVTVSTFEDNTARYFVDGNAAPKDTVLSKKQARKLPPECTGLMKVCKMEIPRINKTFYENQSPRNARDSEKDALSDDSLPSFPVRQRQRSASPSPSKRGIISKHKNQHKMKVPQKSRKRKRPHKNNSRSKKSVPYHPPSESTTDDEDNAPRIKRFPINKKAKQTRNIISLQNRVTSSSEDESVLATLSSSIPTTHMDETENQDTRHCEQVSMKVMQAEKTTSLEKTEKTTSLENRVTSSIEDESVPATTSSSIPATHTDEREIQDMSICEPDSMPECSDSLPCLKSKVTFPPLNSEKGIASDDGFQTLTLLEIGSEVIVEAEQHKPSETKTAKANIIPESSRGREIKRCATEIYSSPPASPLEGFFGSDGGKELKRCTPAIDSSPSASPFSGTTEEEPLIIAITNQDQTSEPKSQKGDSAVTSTVKDDKLSFNKEAPHHLQKSTKAARSVLNSVKSTVTADSQKSLPISEKDIGKESNITTSMSPKMASKIKTSSSDAPQKRGITKSLTYGESEKADSKSIETNTSNKEYMDASGKRYNSKETPDHSTKSKKGISFEPDSITKPLTTSISLATTTENSGKVASREKCHKSRLPKMIASNIKALRSPKESGQHSVADDNIETVVSNTGDVEELSKQRKEKQVLSYTKDASGKENSQSIAFVKKIPAMDEDELDDILPVKYSDVGRDDHSTTSKKGISFGPVSITKLPTTGISVATPKEDSGKVSSREKAHKFRLQNMTTVSNIKASRSPKKSGKLSVANDKGETATSLIGQSANIKAVGADSTSKSRNEKQINSDSKDVPERSLLLGEKVAFMDKDELENILPAKYSGLDRDDLAMHEKDSIPFSTNDAIPQNSIDASGKKYDSRELPDHSTKYMKGINIERDSIIKPPKTNISMTTAKDDSLQKMATVSNIKVSISKSAKESGRHSVAADRRKSAISQTAHFEQSVDTKAVDTDEPSKPRNEKQILSDSKHASGKENSQSTSLNKKVPAMDEDELEDILPAKYSELTGDDLAQNETEYVDEGSSEFDINTTGHDDDEEMAAFDDIDCAEFVSENVQTPNSHCQRQDADSSKDHTDDCDSESDVGDVANEQPLDEERKEPKPIRLQHKKFRAGNIIFHFRVRDKSVAQSLSQNHTPTRELNTTKVAKDDASEKHHTPKLMPLQHTTLKHKKETDGKGEVHRKDMSVKSVDHHNRHPCSSTSNLFEQQRDQLGRFCCLSCTFKTSHVKMYITHIQEHHQTKKQYLCNVCGTLFKRSNLFEMHLYKHKMTRDDYGKEKYPNERTHDRYYDKESKHSGRGRKGQRHYDSQKATKLASTRVAEKSSTQRDHNTIKCPYCSAENFTDEKSLRDHKDLCHPYLKTSRRQYKYKCEICHKKFGSEHMVQNHILTNHPLTCTICRAQFADEESFNDHRDTSHKSDYTCRECGKKCATGLSLKTHMRMMHISRSLAEDLQEPQPPQEECDAADVTTKEREKVESSNQSGTLAYGEGAETTMSTSSIQEDRTRSCCYVCLSIFHTTKTLKAHLLKHSIEMREHMCMRCGQQFSERDQVSNHMVMKHSEELYKCNVCGLVCNTFQILSTHKKTHHESKTCRYCDKVMRSEWHRHKHETWHEKHQLLTCGICQSKFENVSSLVQHRVSQHPKKSTNYKSHTVTQSSVENTASTSSSTNHDSLSQEDSDDCTLVKSDLEDLLGVLPEDDQLNSSGFSDLIMNLDGTRMNMFHSGLDSSNDEETAQM